MNGQVERANGLILQGLKPRIFDMLKKFAGRWVEELPAVLWSLRTTPNRSTGLTPFFLAYGSEAVLPSDLDYGAPRVKAFDPETAAEAQRDAMEVLVEARLATLHRSACYQKTLSKASKDVASRRSGLATSHVDEGQAQALATMGRNL